MKAFYLLGSRKRNATYTLMKKIAERSIWGGWRVIKKGARFHTYT